MIIMIPIPIIENRHNKTGMNIQRVLTPTPRCCVERECVDSVTGRWSGVGIMGFLSQCHIKTSAEKEAVMSVYLDAIISPGICSASPPVTHSYTTTKKPVSP